MGQVFKLAHIALVLIIVRLDIKNIFVTGKHSLSFELSIIPNQMQPTLSNFINLDKKFLELQINNNNAICILPENIEDVQSLSEFVYTENAVTLRKLFKKNNVAIEMLDNTEVFRQRRSVDWYAPTLFISFSLLTENSTLISVALNILSNYVTNFFKGTFGKKNVKFDIVVETSPKKTYKKIQ